LGADLNAAVDAALASEQIRPGAGVAWADWKHGKRRPTCAGNLSLEELRHLGLTLQPDQVLLTVDEVLTRRLERGHFLE
jgi:hypothetical protein